jgi:tetratricopeptide (TPR) repeat protein
MRRTWFAVLAAWAWGTWAFAEPPASSKEILRQSYAAYVEAMSKNDLAAAEAAAERAWRTAEDANASTDQIAVLAFNLAQTRLDQNRDKEAIEPARRAFDLSKAGAKGVDPVEAQFLLGEALTANSASDAKKEIDTAIEAAKTSPRNYREYIYSAARSLARAGMKQRQWRTSLDAWTIAFDNVNPESPNANAWRGEAMTGRGIALIYLQKDKAAAEALFQAVNLLVPYATETDRNEVTIAEALYANAVGWRLAVAARLKATAARPPDLPEPSPRKLLPNAPPLCEFSIVPKPAIQYPPIAASDLGFGGAVLRFWIDDQGAVQSYKVLATLPNQSFEPSFTRPGQKFETFLSPASPPNCRRATKDALQNVIFGGYR